MQRKEEERKEEEMEELGSCYKTEPMCWTLHHQRRIIQATTVLSLCQGPVGIPPPQGLPSLLRVQTIRTQEGVRSSETPSWALMVCVKASQTGALQSTVMPLIACCCHTHTHAHAAPVLFNARRASTR